MGLVLGRGHPAEEVDGRAVQTVRPGLVHLAAECPAHARRTELLCERGALVYELLGGLNGASADESFKRCDQSPSMTTEYGS